MKKILPSVTTFDKSDWKSQINEIIALDIKEIAIFLTSAPYSQRKEIYHALEQVNELKIPFCHLRSDMSPEELMYLKNKFSTKSFNIHPQEDFALKYDLSNYLKEILIENSCYDSLFTIQELEHFAGICLDLSHLEDARRLRPARYNKIVDLMKKYPVRANHISAVRSKARFENNRRNYAYHEYIDLSDFDYLIFYPSDFFSDIIAIEVKNPIEEQLKAIDYIKQIIPEKLVTGIDKLVKI